MLFREFWIMSWAIRRLDLRECKNLTRIRLSLKMNWTIKRRKMSILIKSKNSSRKMNKKRLNITVDYW